MTNTEIQNLTPRQIVNELETYIVGQKNAKKSVAISLRNRWRRMNSSDEMRDEIMPNNILLIGPTGVGKTEIARRLAKLAGAPFLKVEASKFTEVGYVGRDVESMIRDLTDIAVNMVKSEMQETVKKKAEKIVEDRILDLLIPPVKKKEGAGFTTNENFNTDQASDAELNERTRQKFRKKLQDGELNDRKIEIEVKRRGKPMMQVFGPGGMDEMGINLQDLMGNLSQNKKKKKELPIKEAREVLLEEEAERLVDHDAAVSEALERVQTSGIVFIDEIDKVAAPTKGDGKGGGPDVSRQGVQRDMLPIVEGTTVSTKHGMINTDHILFIGSGAFHVSKPSDLIPELQGRFPIRVELNSLTENDFVKILTEPKNALTKQYKAMLASEGITLEFKEEAIKELAKIAARVNERIENIGARRLNTIMSSLLEELLFIVPDDIHDGTITIDKEYVEKQLDEVVTDQDLSHYIL